MKWITNKKMQLKSVRIETMVLKKLKTTYIANHKIKKTFH